MNDPAERRKPDPSGAVSPFSPASAGAVPAPHVISGGAGLALLPAPVGFGLPGPIGWGDTACADCGEPCKLYVEYVHGAAVPAPDRSRCQSCLMDASAYCRTCGGVDAHLPTCGGAA